MYYYMYLFNMCNLHSFLIKNLTIFQSGVHICLVMFCGLNSGNMSVVTFLGTGTFGAIHADVLPWDVLHR